MIWSRQTEVLSVPSSPPVINNHVKCNGAASSLNGYMFGFDPCRSHSGPDSETRLQEEVLVHIQRQHCVRLHLPPERASSQVCPPRASSPLLILRTAAFVFLPDVSPHHLCWVHCFFCMVSAGKRLLRIWPFPTAGPRDRCCTGWTTFSLRSPSPSSTDPDPA